MSKLKLADQYGSFLNPITLDKYLNFFSLSRTILPQKEDVLNRKAQTIKYPSTLIFTKSQVLGSIPLGTYLKAIATTTVPININIAGIIIETIDEKDLKTLIAFL
jgi:hypothetical protein